MESFETTCEWTDLPVTVVKLPNGEWHCPACDEHWFEARIIVHLPS